MGWLEDLHSNTIFHYVNPEGMVVSGLKKDLCDYFGDEVSCTPGESITYEGSVYTYSGFESNQTRIITKTVFEKNGRKAILIKDGKGRNIVRSMTKENHLKGKGTDSVLTKGCIEKSHQAKETILRDRWNAWRKQ